MSANERRAPGSVLVIGASRGIGLELVRQSRADGAAVVATARDPAGLARLQALGARALLLDVADALSVSALAWQVDGEAFDQVYVNAGVYGPDLRAPNAPTRDDFDAVMRTNVLGPMQVVPQVVDALAPGACVAVITSIMGSIGGRSNGAAWLYRASKAAANSVLRDLSFALEGQALCVALHPGWVRTDMGGPGADLSVIDSVAGLRVVMAGLTADDHGRFLNHLGQPLPW